MKKFNILLIILLCLCLAGLLFLRWQTKEGPAVPVIVETAPPAPSPTATIAPTPTPATAPTPSPVPTPEPTAFLPPQGYTEESYNLVSDMVYAYADRQEAAADIIRSDLEQLNALAPALGSLWTKLMRTWSMVNSELTVNPGVLPDGLPEDESLCIVVLGFQLESDGSMAPELQGRCETALRCAEKYPNALIAVTGGGTAWQAPGATEAGVMADAAQVVLRLPDNIFTEGIRQLVYIAGEHQVQPYDQAHFIAGFEKILTGIDAAAPDPDAVEVGIAAVLQQLPGAFRTDAGQQIILRNVIRAHGKKPDTVAAEGELGSPLILFGGDSHGAQTQPKDPFILRTRFRQTPDRQGIEGLISQPIGPPEAGSVNPECEGLV